MSTLDLQKQPHRRLNQLTAEWVLVSPQRTQRPWQGQVEETPDEKLPQYDPKCYLCPRNERAGGQHNPDYTETFVFNNDFPALLPDTPAINFSNGDLFIAEAEPGLCRVVCFSPRHDLTIAGMDPADIRKVVDVWVQQYQELGALPAVNAVQIFENRGAMMGASNPHPHGQIWASLHLPNETVKELKSFETYHKDHGSCVLCDYFEKEKQEQVRVVCANHSFIGLVPFWGVWPFELLVVGKRHVQALDELDNSERDDLAGILKQLTMQYDRLFHTSFPYTMGFHQRPTDGGEYETYHLHAHFYPPLLRSATIRKFMVGYEMLATPQRDITPEQAASRLRDSRG